MRIENRTGRGVARRIARIGIVALVAWWLVAWIAARCLIVSAPLERAEAVAVLAGSAAYVERTRRAAELYGARRAARVVLTDDGERGSWSSAEQRNPLFVERAAEELRRRGVPAERIEIAPGLALGTHEEAALLRRYAEARSLRSVTFVTSAYHSRRAWWTLRRAFAGSNVEIGIESVATGGESPAPYGWWLTARGWREVAGEYVKLVYYWTHY